MTELWLQGLSAVALALLLNPLVQLVGGLVLLWVATERQQSWHWLARYAGVSIGDLESSLDARLLGVPEAAESGAGARRRVALRGRVAAPEVAAREQPPLPPGAFLLADEAGRTVRVRTPAGAPVPRPREDLIVFGLTGLVAEPSLYREAPRRVEVLAEAQLPVATVMRALRGAEALRVLGSLCLAVGTGGVVLLLTYAMRLAF